MKSKYFFVVLILLVSMLSCIRKLTGPDEAEGVWSYVRESDDGTYWDMTFTDSNNGWIVGDQGRILHTSDGGETWEEQQSGTENHLHCVSFIDANHGWAAGKYLAVVRTEDGGKNWQLVHANPDSDHIIMSFFFYDEQVGVMATNHGEIYQSRDGGFSWTLREKAEKVMGCEGDFRRSGLAVIASLSGYNYCSYDQGNSWKKYPQQNTAWATDLSFVDKQNGWLCNSRLASSYYPDYAAVFRTKDGGKSWIKLSELLTSHLNSVFFTDVSSGWTAGGNLIYHTTNGGETWSVADTCAHLFIQKLWFADNSHGWALGWHGEVLKYQ